MKPIFSLILSSMLVALLASCGTSAPTPNPTSPVNPSPTNPTQPTPTPSNPAVSSVSFKTAALLPEGLKDVEQELTPSVVQLVALARSKSQNPNALTGTLTQSGNTVSYSATPTDRLKLVSNGKTFEFFITSFQGNLASGANAFYKANHLVEYRANFVVGGSMGAVSMLVSSQRQGNILGVKLGGTAVFEGVSNVLSLEYRQQTLSDFGPGSIEFHHADTLAGSISGANLQIQINETYDFKVVGGSSSLVQQTIRTFDNAWAEGGAQFRLQNGRIQKVFRDGNPIEADFWKAQGVLTRNGTQVGGLGQAFTGNILEFFFDTPNGRIRLEANQF